MRNDILTSARAWIGTPYVHQASTKHAGADCLGLLRGVWREALGVEPVAAPNYTPDWSEPTGEETLWSAARAYLKEKPRTDAAAGDVLLFRMRAGSVAKHLGIQGKTGEGATFVHAYMGHGVVESPLSLPWQRRIVARFEFPEEGK
ncbi:MULTISPECIES: NlpC/P60 family protein [Halocynthiibacter]|uniref:NlpC/P60 family protein n=1 Tax=Halocynthiibacter halioticoli TaxID=2986804 RepID=A0AAE3LSX0_9RHOB|nr:MULTISPECIES: NlpC/P60 family protein [Halocynthiibacter]MCV6824096.1 NlpC/P60 family protein [Halocynthiibacter halioticoli]MCW4057097.1 NlpC/P60 family protein [Halocynthiibacter sp. SDUM655004]